MLKLSNISTIGAKWCRKMFPPRIDCMNGRYMSPALTHGLNQFATTDCINKNYTYFQFHSNDYGNFYAYKMYLAVIPGR